MATSEEEVDISTQDDDKRVNEMVKAILILDRSKKPFKQIDISRLISKKPGRKDWNAIFEGSKARLKEMGLTLLEANNTNVKTFILISSMFPMPSMYSFAEENEVADRTLLILVLTFIFMKEGPVTNDDILNHLQELNIYSERNPIHEYFGDVKKKILIDFVCQLYLEKISDKDSQTLEIKWGARSHAEVSKRSILQFVCDIGYAKAIQPKHLASQYRAVMNEEGEEKEEISENNDELMALED